MIICPKCGGSYASPYDLVTHETSRTGIYGGLTACEWRQGYLAEREEYPDGS